jgi:hypothetical protein
MVARYDGMGLASLQNLAISPMQLCRNCLFPLMASLVSIRGPPTPLPSRDLLNEIRLYQ